MKIVVIGGTGLIGSKVVGSLRAQGHEAVAAAPNTGVNTLTGEGVADALAGAEVVVDLSNSPSFDDDAVLDFFRTSGGVLAEAEREAGVGHHVALSIVGVDRLPESGYMRAKLAQEEIVKESGVPYTIIHSTQFFEFIRGIANSGTVDGEVRVSSATLQPITAADIAAVVTETALGAPVNGTFEIAGPDRLGLDVLVRTVLEADGDPRAIVGDPHARYFGAELTDGSLTPGAGARLASTTFAQWLAANPLSAVPAH